VDGERVVGMLSRSDVARRIPDSLVGLPAEQVD
jgi:hypothetical protein